MGGCEAMVTEREEREESESVVLSDAGWKSLSRSQAMPRILDNLWIAVICKVLYISYLYNPQVHV